MGEAKRRGTFQERLEKASKTSKEGLENVRRRVFLLLTHPDFPGFEFSRDGKTVYYLRPNGSVKRLSWEEFKWTVEEINQKAKEATSNDKETYIKLERS